MRTKYKIKIADLLLCSGEDKVIPKKILIINYFFVFIVLLAVFFLSFSMVEVDFRWSVLWEYKNKLLSGLFTTIFISIFSLFLSLLFGAVLAILRRNNIIFFRVMATVIIELIRGTPLIVQTLIFFYIVADAVGLENRYVAGVIIVSLFSGAYISEIIRAGIKSVGATQLETARSLAFSKFQTYIYIIIPQVTTRILPALAGQFASIIKDTSILSIISIEELTMSTQDVVSVTYSTLELYIPLAIGYLLLTFPISLYSKKLEEKFHYET